MQNHWTKDDVAAAWQRFERTYAHDPVAYRFLCGHCIQDETDEDALDYNIIGVWLVCHRKYRDWSTEKSYDLAWILEFMQAYHMTIPRYIKRTKFYRKKMKLLLSSLVRDKDQSQEKKDNDMAELNLKQIIDRLNAEFTGETRKLVFWYDDKAEFAEDMETVELQNAKIYHLQPDNQFYTKYFLERVDKTTNYLIYAPFPKPDVRDNHLEDTMLYSRRFFADRASLLSVDLGIEEKYKPVIEKHIKFFANKERTQRFYDLEIENFNEEKYPCRSAECSLQGAYLLF